MQRLRLNMILDREQLGKVIGYYMYRSQEMELNRPIIDGVYIQRKQLGETPPESLTLLLEWNEEQ